MRGCYQYHKKAGGDRVDNVEVDTEQGSCVSTSDSQDSKMSNPSKISGPNTQCHVREPAGFWGYVFQIIFQVICSRMSWGSRKYIVLMHCMDMQLFHIICFSASHYMLALGNSF